MSIETYDGTTDLVHDAAQIDPTGGRLVAWAKSLVAAKQLADALCRTTFAPPQFRGKPEDAAAAILFGDEIGLTPGQSLQNVTVISGRPGLYARTMVALVLSKGHRVWTETDTPDKVTVCGTRAGTAHTERSEWTKDRARKAGYTNNKKYETDPQAMLYARAASDVCRKIAPDALAGLAYTAEEMELEQAQTTTTVQRAPRATTAQRAPLPPAPSLDAPQSEPPAPDEQSTDEPGPPLPTDLAFDAQHRMMRALVARVPELHDADGKPDREKLLTYARRVCEAPDLTSSKELTRSQMTVLIDELGKDVQP